MNRKKEESKKKRFQKLAGATEAINSIIEKAKKDTELTSESVERSIKDIKGQRKAEVISISNKAVNIDKTKKTDKPGQKYDDDFLDMLEEIRNEGDDNE